MRCTNRQVVTYNFAFQRNGQGIQCSQLDLSACSALHARILIASITSFPDSLIPPCLFESWHLRLFLPTLKIGTHVPSLKGGLHFARPSTLVAFELCWNWCLKNSHAWTPFFGHHAENSISDVSKRMGCIERIIAFDFTNSPRSLKTLSINFKEIFRA